MLDYALSLESHHFASDDAMWWILDMRVKVPCA